MFKTVELKIDDIYVPVDRKKEQNQAEIDTLVENLLEDEAPKPIRVREGKGRYVLIEGVNQLEANKAVGEQTVSAYIVQARKF